MDNDKKEGIEKIISDVVRAASVAADEVGELFQSVAATAGERYDVVKLKYAISRLREEQSTYFTAMGKQLYLVHSSGKGDAQQPEKDAAVVDAEKAIAELLVLAEQKQLEITASEQHLFRANGEKVCHNCGKNSAPKSLFCSICGVAL